MWNILWYKIWIEDLSKYWDKAWTDSTAEIILIVLKQNSTNKHSFLVPTGKILKFCHKLESEYIRSTFEKLGKIQRDGPTGAYRGYFRIENIYWSSSDQFSDLFTHANIWKMLEHCFRLNRYYCIIINIASVFFIKLIHPNF